MGDWSTQVVARRWRIGASRRIRWTHTAPQADVMTLASTAIMAPVDPANAVAAGTTQNPLFGLTAHASSAPSPALRRPRVICDRAQHEPESGGQCQRSDQLAGRGQPPGGGEGERGRRDQDLHAQHDGPDPSDLCAAVRRAPAEQPAHQEADQAEHTQIVPRRRSGAPPVAPGANGSPTDKVPRCTLNGSTRCSRRRLSGVICLRTPSIGAGKQEPFLRASLRRTRSSTGISSASSR